jgi:hypothetical protein
MVTLIGNRHVKKANSAPSPIFQKIQVHPTEKERMLEKLSETERKKYLSPEEKVS